MALRPNQLFDHTAGAQHGRVRPFESESGSRGCTDGKHATRVIAECVSR
jgi:hypothetical protein